MGGSPSAAHSMSQALEDPQVQASGSRGTREHYMISSPSGPNDPLEARVLIPVISNGSVDLGFWLLRVQ